MKSIKLLSLALLILGFAAGFADPLRGATAGEAPRVNRAQLVTVEQALDDRWRRLWTDNDVVLFGPTRAVFLDGYGLVVTTEINPVKSIPIFMFHPTATPEEVVQHHTKKLQRIPELKRAMRDAMVLAATSMDSVPEDSQVVLTVLVAKYPWEDLTGLPSRIMMQSGKKKLLELRGNPAGLESAIQVTEF